VVPALASLVPVQAHAALREASMTAATSLHLPGCEHAADRQALCTCGADWTVPHEPADATIARLTREFEEARAEVAMLREDERQVWCVLNRHEREPTSETAKHALREVQAHDALADKASRLRGVRWVCRYEVRDLRGEWIVGHQPRSTIQGGREEYRARHRSDIYRNVRLVRVTRYAKPKGAKQ
jgi:hypothetical protein